MSTRKRSTPGLYEIHARKCASRAQGRCNCTPTWQAWVAARRPGEKPVRRNFKSKTEAKNWRADAIPAVRAGRMKAATRRTVGEALDSLLEGMRAGTWLTRQGTPYKPSATRSYKRAADKMLRPRFGHLRLSSMERRDVQSFVDDMVAEGVSASRIRNTLDPLRVIVNRAIEDGDLALDPMLKLRLPANRGRRERVADRAEAAALLAALDDSERAQWATGMGLEARPEPGARGTSEDGLGQAREDALKPIALHEARHSAASYLIEAGLNDLELTAMIGHSDSRTTRNIYGHLFPDSTERVAAKLDAYHGEAASSVQRR